MKVKEKWREWTHMSTFSYAPIPHTHECECGGELDTVAAHFCLDGRVVGVYKCKECKKIHRGVEFMLNPFY